MKKLLLTTLALSILSLNAHAKLTGIDCNFTSNSNSNDTTPISFVIDDDRLQVTITFKGGSVVVPAMFTADAIQMEYNQKFSAGVFKQMFSINRNNLWGIKVSGIESRFNHGDMKVYTYGAQCKIADVINRLI